jgi:mono/diheme cytochrome c family protein
VSHPNLDDAFPERRRDFSVPSRAMLLSIVGFITGVVLLFTAVTPGAADRQLIERGKYLVTLGGCTDCHTPGYFFGKPDPARQLGGSEVGFEIAGLGCFTGRT